MLDPPMIMLSASRALAGYGASAAPGLPRPARPGYCGAMVRFLVLYHTPDDPAAFDRHYRDVHIPLAKKLPGLRRYTVSRGVTTVRGQSFYLVAELDWDDLESMQAAFASPEGKAASEDVPTFATGGSESIAFEVEEV
jgi:uncharacterized protein (TIGR02118 family)